MMLEIAFDADEEWDSSRRWEPLVRKAAEAAIAESAFPDLMDSDRAIEMSVTLTGDEEVRALNAKWRGKDKPTNVLSFPAPASLSKNGGRRGMPVDHYLPLGDLVICAEVVRREAVRDGKAIAAHWAHLVIHGALHLAGYDHEVSRRERLRMERREIAVLRSFGIGNPYT